MQANLGNAVETEILKSVRTVVQEQAGEIKVLLERALKDNLTLNNSLIEVCQSVNSLKDSVRQDVAPVGQIFGMTHRVLDDISALHGALNSEMAEIKKRTTDGFSRVLAAIESAKEDAGASTKRTLEMHKKALAYAEKK